MTPKSRPQCLILVSVATERLLVAVSSPWAVKLATDCY